MIILKLEDNIIELHTHEVEGAMLYKAQDLLKGCNLTQRQVAKKLENWGNIPNYPNTGVVKLEGRYGGTYLTKRNTLKLAGYISYDFEDAVYEAFELASEGNSQGAINVATKVAIPQELIDKESELRKTLNKLIQEKFPDKKMVHSNFSRLIAKAASGFTPKELTNGVDSSFKYMVGEGHISAVGCYIACLENAIMGLKVGLDYHTVAAMLQVVTTKNKKAFN